jgi:glycosyltransferase involved in cell wall biosynthesis
MPSVSLILTVLNEGDHIRRLLDSLLAQTQPPAEIVVVDGGSRDQTVAILESYADRLPLRILVEPGANISAGRNRAIAAAQHDLIAVTDAGVVLEPDWLAHISAPFADASVQVVSGFFVADPQTVFEAALGATVLPRVEEIDPATFLPSSRSLALRRSAWAAVEGYPEWLDYCEDLIFDLRLKMRGSFTFAPAAVAHFRPRGSLRAFYRQYYLYARGDGKADLWRKRHAIRYVTYLLAIPLIGLLGAWLHPLWWLAYGVGAVVYLYPAYRRLPGVLRRLPRLTPFDWLRALLLIPLIRIVGDVAKMHGYPVGLVWRGQQHPPDWRQPPVL